jgi:hypothetical protein
MADLTEKEVIAGTTDAGTASTVKPQAPAAIVNPPSPTVVVKGNPVSDAARYSATSKPVPVITKDVVPAGAYAGGVKHPKDYTDRDKAGFKASGFPRSAPATTGTMALTPDDQSFVAEKQHEKLKDAADDAHKAEIKTENANHPVA